ncbi:PREDICTED: probable E3 ubiquitin-protein ligase RHY1A [Ipomoea nil]|uniref:probable E3 ubiquitin-protein ligase RHY1A n=1 Tax=Ipomoea nil TaxID=35883 RepID=UPI0009014241|nr:PREDICTED: probable E3 ubiquitin-protein ligase RHY1A [Ipomoea nil]XP_019165527.1 PREDICTED: probable E3 ubiquitin-protein ligase RHY1A [Ipomoea nil]
MTKALELFHNRRTRLGRSIPVIESDQISSHDNHINRHRNHRRHSHSHSSSTDRRVDRNDLNGCDNPRRSLSSIHRSSFPERESLWVDLSSTPSSSGNVNSIENEFSIQDRLRITGNERLPSAVLLARERLLQRLRGVSLSGNRQSNRVAASFHRRDSTIADDFQLTDAIDWETEISREWHGADMFSNSLRPDKISRPPGLTKEALESLPVKIFRNLDYTSEAVPSIVRECSICLEAFLDGDKLISLPCGHMFHKSCLVPWVQTCGDCPNCRAGISSLST